MARSGNRRWFLKGAAAAISTGATIGVAELASRKLFGESLAARALGLTGNEAAVKAAADMALAARGESSDDLEKMHARLMRSTNPPDLMQYNERIQFAEYSRRFTWDRLAGDDQQGVKVHSLGFTVPMSRDFDRFEPDGLMAGGCSFTIGSGVPREYSWPVVAAAEMGCDGYNFGVGSYSYVTALHQLEDLIATGIVAKLKPRHYVLGAGKWLYNRSTSPFYPTRYFRLMFPYVAGVESEPKIERPSERHTLRNLIELLRAYFPNGKDDTDLTDERRDLLAGMLGKVQEVERKAITFRRDITPGSLYRLLLARFQRLCDEAGMEFSVLWIPSRKNPQENMPQMEVECARIGCR